MGPYNFPYFDNAQLESEVNQLRQRILGLSTENGQPAGTNRALGKGQTPSDGLIATADLLDSINSTLSSLSYSATTTSTRGDNFNKNGSRKAPKRNGKILKKDLDEWLMPTRALSVKVEKLVATTKEPNGTAPTKLKKVPGPQQQAFLAHFEGTILPSIASAGDKEACQTLLEEIKKLKGREI